MEWAGLDHVLIIEIFGAWGEARLPQVKGTDSSWASDCRRKLQKLPGCQSQWPKTFRQGPEDPSSLGIR